MKPAAAPRSRSLKFAITPMIDIVFLLIIFFLVSTHFVKSETLAEVDLPAASEAENEEVSSRRMTVTVLADGSYSTGNRPIKWTDLEAKLLSIEKPSEDEEEFEVRIRSDKQTPYKFVKRILEICAQAGITKISFTVIAEVEGA